MYVQDRKDAKMMGVYKAVNAFYAAWDSDVIVAHGRWSHINQGITITLPESRTRAYIVTFMRHKHVLF
jgi:hypothetical protein